MSKFAVPVRSIFRKRRLHDSFYLSSYPDLVGIEDGWGGELVEHKKGNVTLFIRKQFTVAAESLKVSCNHNVDEKRFKVNQAI